MRPKHTRKYVAGIDIGSNTVYSIIAFEDENGQVNILGTGATDSRGVKQGIVIDMDDVVNAVICSLEEAEDLAGVETEAVYLTVNGPHIVGVNNSGHYHLDNSHREVTYRDINQAIHLSNQVPLPDNREIIHTVLRGFAVDGMQGVRNPFGMRADTIEACVHVITASTNPIQNLIKAVQRTGVEIRELVFGALACSQIVTTSEERELGSVVINLGAGTTTITCFQNGFLTYSEILPMGGDDLTERISSRFRLTRDMAEDTKRKFSNVALDHISESEVVSINLNSRSSPTVFNKLEFCRVIKSWGEEVFCSIHKKLEKNHLNKNLNSGVILTGGGALIRGIKDLAAKEFESYVRVGSGHNIIGLDTIIRNPCYATIIGVAKYALDLQNNRGDFLFRRKNRLSQWSDDVVNWFRDLF